MTTSYRVTASSRVLGHGPGEVFAAEIVPAQEARLLASGALVREDDGGALDALDRPEIDALAVGAGVDEPHKLANKQAVIDAIDAIDTATNEKGA